MKRCEQFFVSLQLAAQEFAAVDILANSEMAMRVMLPLSRANTNSVHRRGNGIPLDCAYSEPCSGCVCGLLAFLGVRIQ